MFNNIIFISAVFLFSAPYAVQAYETDNFTGRHQALILPDATSILSVYTRIYLVDEVHAFNNEGNDCRMDLARTEPKIFQRLETVLGGPWKHVKGVWNFSSGIERLASLDKEFAPYRFSIPANQSIYKNWWFIENFGIQPAVRMQQYMVGLDKIGHFFHDGLAYFRLALSGQSDQDIPFSQQSIEKIDSKHYQMAIQHGIDDESGLNGYWSSKVFSYADLNANFQGFRFWLRLLKGQDPYLKCVDGKYKLNANTLFTFDDYVHPGWDEALNCSAFEAAKQEDKYSAKHEISRLGGCPRSPSNCQYIANLPCAEFHLSHECRPVVSQINKSCRFTQLNLNVASTELMQIQQTSPAIKSPMDRILENLTKKYK